MNRKGCDLNKQEELSAQVAFSNPELAGELHNLRLERDNAITFLATVQNSLAEHSQQLLVALKALEIKDKYIASLLGEQQSLFDNIGVKDTYIASLQKEVGQLRSMIEQKDAYSLSLEEERLKLNHSIGVKDAYIASLLEELQKLRGLLHEKDAYIHSLRAISAQS